MFVEYQRLADLVGGAPLRGVPSPRLNPHLFLLQLLSELLFLECLDI